MEQQIEKVNLAGDVFSVDLPRAGLWLDSSPDKFLPFAQMENLVTRGGVTTHRRILYDTDAKTPYTVDPARVVLPATVKLLELPHEQFMNRGWQQASSPDIIKLDVLEFTKDGLYHAREIPRQQIFGTEFFVDSMMLEMRQVNDRKNRISFQDVSMDQHRIYFDYHLKYKNIPRPEDQFSADVTTAYMPLLKEIDPIVWNRIKKSEVDINELLSTSVPLHPHKPRKVDDPGKPPRPGGRG